MQMYEALFIDFPCSRTLCVLLYSVPKSQYRLEPVQVEGSEKKEKHVQLLLNLVLSFEFKFPTPNWWKIWGSS